jgi:branched-chain amino acid transport system permease protein
MAVIGGFHNVVFAALGGVGLQVLLEALRELGQWRLVVFGLLTLIILRGMPNGIFGGVYELLSKRLKRGGDQ